MKKYTFWFVVGTQHLYGHKIFKIIEKRADEMAEFLSLKFKGFATIEFKSLVKTSDEIYQVAKEANHNDDVVGMITWMHTFSPSKMWIHGLNVLQKPMLQLHTQFNKEIPWDDIDMDFMNLNQSAHGDREHGFIYTRMRKYRSVVSGYYQNEDVIADIERWLRASIGVFESQQLNVVRFGDNMRNVAVTEGNKVSAEIDFGWSVNGWGMGDLVKFVNDVSQNEIREQLDKYKKKYQMDTTNNDSIKYQAKVQVALRKFLKQQQSCAFTTTFENLTGLEQLPGLAVQDLMDEGFGFGAEGDWKTAAMQRIIYLMSIGTSQSCSFMEDYTYHLPDNNETVLGAHMLEVSPRIASTKPQIQVHPLGIGGKDAPARVVFDAKAGSAVQVSLIDLGDRFRLIAADCNAVEPLEKMPKLPVAQAMWTLEPNFKVGTEAWLIAGGAHHTVMTYDIDAKVLELFANMLDIEFVHITNDTTIQRLRNELRWNETGYKLK
ncbi:L-arabinose isomerase [Candidatus Xianfuyuplasma coldseepsis]|uniref:L-arabinose isomerase n=1 Tax=Candidatus Xianfuyuplasma coldseepsis TaxID=2782163 RepID=A0A7L7KSR0_9MOLU|nr:L-arabinose isomerase [Xianfuyuplasma coldseepsis]QMS85783.1 L-arabinose isomerase [Xianfuyuplasma coldseepsis]